MIVRPPAAPLDWRGLVFPFGAYAPEPGTLAEVAPGVLWMRSPLPFALNHINLYVLDAGDHWVIVDTGVASPDIKAQWRAALEGPLAGKPVGRIIVTHYHPDHVGLAGWLAKKSGAPLAMTRGEYMLARVLTLDVRPEPPEEALHFHRRAGWSDDQVEALRARGWGGFARGVAPLPAGFQRLREGDVLTIGQRRWTVVTGAGHSPEHACLLSDDGILIAGDQVLPRITSNVSVYPTEPLADPLGEWLDSLAKLKGLPEATRVLPSHNEPFDGLHLRLDALADDHHRKLDALETRIVEPATAAETFATLFRRPIGDNERGMATGEALAHLHWLERRGRAVRLADADADRFTRA